SHGGEVDQVAIAAGGTVGTGGEERRVGHGDGDGGGSADSSGGRSRKDVAAQYGRRLEIVALRIGAVEGGGEARGQLIETGADAGNFLVANLDQTTEAPTGERSGNVVGTGHDVMHAIGLGLGGQRVTLRAGDQSRAVRRCHRDALIGGNDLDADERGKLLDEIILLVDQG